MMKYCIPEAFMIISLEQMHTPTKYIYGNARKENYDRQKTTEQCKLAVNDKRKKIKSIEQLFVLHAWLFNFPIFEIIIV